MKNSLLIFALLAGSTATALADPVTLTFSGLQDQEEILNYYNGGSGSKGSHGAPNYGIVYSSDSLALISVLNGGTGNFSNVPPPATNTIAFFLNGAGDTMNVAAGFDTGFSFYYAAANTAGSVRVYSGLNGTGTLLETLNLAINGSGCDTTGQPYDCWTEEGVAFSGTAESVVFGGSANYIGFADVTLGSSTVNNMTPEPGTLLMATTGLLGFAGAVRRRLRA